MEEKEKSEETPICKRCHRRLRDEASKRLGYGKVCYKKICSREHYYLFEMEVPNEPIN